MPPRAAPFIAGGGRDRRSPAAEMSERSAEDSGTVPFCTSHLCLPRPHPWSETRLFFPSALKMGIRRVGWVSQKPPRLRSLSAFRGAKLSPLSLSRMWKINTY